MAHTKYPPDKQYRCDVCSKEFPRRDSLQAHVRTHTKPFTCAKCGRSFARPDSLVAHARNHSGNNDRPYKCVECGKGFGVAQALQTHMRIHTGTDINIRLPPASKFSLYLYQSPSSQSPIPSVAQFPTSCTLSVCCENSHLRVG